MNEEAKLRQYEKMSLKLATSSFGGAAIFLVLGKLLDTDWMTTLMLVIAINLAVIGVIFVVEGVYYAFCIHVKKRKNHQERALLWRCIITG